MNETQSDDFLHSAVPTEARQSAVSILAVWMGFIIVVGIMSVGGGLVAQTSEATFLQSVLIGNLILAAFAGLAGWVGARSGLNFNLLARGAFVDWSWRLMSLYVPIVLIGWFGVEAAIFGNVVGEAFGASEAGRRALMSGSTIMFAITSFFGFSAIRRTSIIMVPLIILLATYAVIASYDADTAKFQFGETSISEGEVIAAVISTWIMGALTCVPDLTRFARSAAAGAAIGALGILIANTFTLLIGGYAAATVGIYDPAKILISLGVLPLAVLFAVANIWSTNDNNMYSAALNVARAGNLHRKVAVVICAILSAIFAYFDPTTIGLLFGFLGFMGNTAPALGGVVIASYFLIPKLGQTSTSIPAWIGWAAGSYVSMVSPAGFSVIAGFLAGALVWIAIGYFERALMTRPPQETEA